MEQTFKISSSPHVRDSKTTSGIMLDVVIALLPASVFGVYNFGLRAFVLILTCVVSCMLFEWAAEMLLHRASTVGDFSAMVTGLLLALNLSPDVPVWMAILGSAFAIIIVKQLFGGLGQNFMNPALGARCFLLISFTGQMTTFTYDGMTTATPLAVLKSGGTVDVMDMFLGRVAGTIGEVSTAAILIGALYLVLRKVISLIIPLTYIGTFTVCIFIYSLSTGIGFEPLYIAAHLCGGGLMLGAFFMATDYVTSPITKKGKWLYGIVLGILTFLLRIYGASAEGVSYAIILSNLLVPLIEKITQPKSFGKGAELQKINGVTAVEIRKVNKLSVLIATIAIFVITFISGVALAYVHKITEKPIENAKQEAKEASYQEVFSAADSFETDEDFDREQAKALLSEAAYQADIDEIVIAKDASGDLLGYVLVVTSHEAYDGDLQLAFGITKDGVINGISFLSISETVGLGMKADTDSFKEQFAGKTVESFRYTKTAAQSDDEIEAISGATVTTNAVVEAVNAGLYYINHMEGGGR